MTNTTDPTDTDRNWLALRNELDRTRAERDSWEAQFHSAAAAASEYSEFWEKHQRDFDQFGNYIPHSQVDGDLRAAKAEIERLGGLAQCPAPEGIKWARVNDEPFEYAIQQGQHGDEFVKLLNGTCLRRALSLVGGEK